MPRRKKKDILEHQLSRRERQIMGAVYRLDKATVAEIEDKGLLRSRPDGSRKVYYPTIDSENARRGALENVIDTFFGGSPRRLVATLLDTRKDELSEEDLDRLTRLIDAAGDDAES
jgi:BlaI family penicillinase repressor